LAELNFSFKYRFDSSKIKVQAAPESNEFYLICLHLVSTYHNINTLFVFRFGAAIKFWVINRQMQIYWKALTMRQKKAMFLRVTLMLNIFGHVLQPKLNVKCCTTLASMGGGK